MIRAMKLVGLAAILALGATAILGAASASASATLCATTETPCAKANEYPAGAFEAKSTNLTIANSISNISCTESALKGETTATSGDPLPLNFTAWALGGCKTAAGTTCTVKERNQPSSGRLGWQGGQGSLEITSGGSGAPGWKITCGTAISCEFLPTSPVLDAQGATLTASKEAVRSELGAICPNNTASFSGTYTITTPSPAYVAPGEGTLPAGWTALCKANSSTCAEADRYPSGTSFEATSTGVLIEGNVFDKECSSSTLSGSIGTPEEEGLPVSISGWTFSGCHGPSGMSCSMTVKNLPYPGTVTWGSGGNGTLSVDKDLTLLVLCGGGWENCTTSYGPHARLSGGNPAQLAFESVQGEREGSVCQSIQRFTATYQVSSPTPLFVSHT